MTRRRWFAAGASGIAAVVLAVVACHDNNNNGSSSEYRIGAPCSSSGTCPPGQTCIAGNICSIGCSTPGQTMGGGPTECSGPCGNGGIDCMFSCDIDLYCKQGCNPGGGTCTTGSCPNNEICDGSFNICRQRCGGGSDGGGSCPSGQECFDDPQDPGCPYCRPRGGVGTFGQPCTTAGTCINNGGSALTCDPLTHTCLVMCGIGTMSCSNGANCPTGYGCDNQGNICRPLCTGGRCPAGTSGVCTTAGSCQICRGMPMPDGGVPDAGNGIITTLATTPGASHIAIDVSNVYWTTSIDLNDIRRCAIAGCNGQPDQIATAFDPIGISLQGGRVYWNNNGNSAASCVTNGTCGGNPMLLGMFNQQGGGGIAVGAGVLLAGTGVGVVACSSGGCGSSASTVFSGPVSEWIAFNPSNNNFYFGSTQQILVHGPNTTSSSMPVTTSGAGPLPIGIVANGNDIYWTYNQGVLSCSVSGCGNNPRLLAGGPGYAPQGIAVDETNVYWADLNGAQGGGILFCARNGTCNPQTFVSGQNQPHDVVVDSMNVYWTNQGDGTVKKAPK